MNIISKFKLFLQEFSFSAYLNIDSFIITKENRLINFHEVIQIVMSMFMDDRENYSSFVNVDLSDSPFDKVFHPTESEQFYFSLKSTFNIDIFR